MARLYANENLPFPVVEELRRLGHDVLTTYESGQAGKATYDEDVLGFSLAEGRILITLNRRHFVRLHKTRPDHAGIVVCSFDPDSVGLAHRIHVSLASRPLLQGELLRINRPG